MPLQPGLQKWLLVRTNVDAAVNLLERQLQFAFRCRNLVLGKELLYFVALGHITKNAGGLYQRSFRIIAKLGFYLGPVLPDKVPGELAPSGILHYRSDHLWCVLRTHSRRNCKIKRARQ